VSASHGRGMSTAPPGMSTAGASATTLILYNQWRDSVAERRKGAVGVRWSAAGSRYDWGRNGSKQGTTNEALRLLLPISKSSVHPSHVAKFPRDLCKFLISYVLHR
jgi:hypothetical protein